MLRGCDSLSRGIAHRPHWLTPTFIAMLLLTLVIAAYFLPWSKGEEGLLVSVYSQLTTAPPKYIIPVLASIIVSLAFALTALALVTGTRFLERKRRQILRTASLASGAAIAGSLLYSPGWFLIGYSWQDYWEWVDELDIGWFVSLAFGSAAWLLLLYAFHEVMGIPERHQSPRNERFGRGSRSLFTHLLILMSAVGAVLAVVGCTQTWGSGTNYVLNSFVTWSKTGVEASPSISLVLVASVASVVTLVYSQTSASSRIEVLNLATESALVAGLVTTILWGFAISGHTGWSHDPYTSWGMTTTLGDGWYLSLSGQLVTFASLLVVPRFQRAHLAKNE